MEVLQGKVELNKLQIQLQVLYTIIMSMLYSTYFMLCIYVKCCMIVFVTYLTGE